MPVRALGVELLVHLCGQLTIGSIRVLEGIKNSADLIEDMKQAFEQV